MSSFKYKSSGDLYKSLAEDIRELTNESVNLTEGDTFNLNYYESRAKQNKAFYEKNIKPIVDEYSDGVIVSYEIRYKPIFQDINDFKRILNQKSVKCFNPIFKANSLITGYKILPKLD